MKVTNVLFNATVLQANYSSRIRLSDISDEYNELTNNITLIYGSVILFIILCIAVICICKEHKKGVKSIGKFFFVCLGIYIVLAIGNGVYYNVTHKRNHSEANGGSAQTFGRTIESPPAEHMPIHDDYTEHIDHTSFSDRTTEKKKNDFLVAVTNNPSYRIYDFYLCGLSPENTQFLSEEEYAQSNWVKERYSQESLHETYMKLCHAWKAFVNRCNVNLEDPEIEKYMYKYDMFSIDRPNINNASDPELIKDLSYIPLGRKPHDVITNPNNY
ncbi:hypothetical protein [Hoylesella loescheii]|uniref:hypothetical protein n=1 Tax=Hoylesella loescheii TaxID=840 RepID=UPI0028E54C7D|nr:hypothetical protein [Hoylesella loescheii]